jgi:ankyrin repeat protein
MDDQSIWQSNEAKYMNYRSMQQLKELQTRFRKAQIEFEEKDDGSQFGKQQQQQQHHFQTQHPLFSTDSRLIYPSCDEFNSCALYGSIYEPTLVHTTVFDQNSTPSLAAPPPQPPPPQPPHYDSIRRIISFTSASNTQERYHIEDLTAEKMKTLNTFSHQIKSIKQDLESIQQNLTLSQQNEQALQHQLRNLKLTFHSDCKVSIQDPPGDNDPIITQFKPEHDQWELNDDNINRLDVLSYGTILHNYCEHIYSTPLGVFKYLVETKGCHVRAQSCSGDTPLHSALRSFRPNSDVNILIYLLCWSADVNLKSQNGHTILHLACEKINSLPLDVFKYIIEVKGGDVNIRDKNYNFAPIHIALSRFNSDNGGDVNILTYLLDQKGVKVNIYGDCGFTLLHFACRNVCLLPINVFKYLIEKKGATFLCDKEGNTPLHILLFDLFSKPDDKLSEIVLYFIQKGITINQQNSMRQTPLGLFTPFCSTHPLTYQVLIQNGAKVANNK